MKSVIWTDPDNITRKSILPDNIDDSEAIKGVPVGVDIIENLVNGGMPYETAVRLQNELRRRGYWTARDIKETAGIFAALQSAYRLDTAAIINIYKEAK